MENIRSQLMTLQRLGLYVYVVYMYMVLILRRISPRPILFGRRRDLEVKPKPSRARVKQHINLSRKYGTMAPG